MVLVVFGVVPFGLAGEDRPFDFVDDSSFPTVHVVITPPAGSGAIGAEDVTVTQDGEPVEAVVTPLGSEPIEVVLLIDTSGSMAGAPLVAAQEAAVAFVEALPVGSDVAVLGFGSEVVLVAPLGSSVEEVAAAIGGLVAEGDTALHDAVIAAAAALELSAQTRQFMVLLSDGGDTASGAGLDDAVSALESIEVGFYAVELEGSELDRAALVAMADAARGRLVPAADAAALSEAYGEIASEVVSQYAVSFEALHGGDSVIQVVVGSGASATTFSSEVSLPGSTDGVARPVVTLTVPTPRTVTPVPTRTAEPPGGFQQDWALNVGVALLAVTLLVVLAYALMPATAPSRRSSLLAVPGERSPRVRRRRRFRRSRLLDTEYSDDEVFRPRPSRGIEASLEAAGVAMSATEYVLAVTGLALLGAALSLLLGGLVFARRLRRASGSRGSP